MKVEDALKIGELSKGEVITGREGLSRKILSIEVMEVPEVGNWITEGILMLTTFYSVKDDFDKQYDILKTLIEKRAAGLVVKLGRFLNHLPEEMIKLAEKNAFPIISIPKNVSYINVLTPLYEKLYEEKERAKQNSFNPFHDFVIEDYAMVVDAIENLSEILEAQVYIEDCEGQLLYSSKTFSSDGWRNSNLLFSAPSNPNYKELIKEWKSDFQHGLLRRAKFSDQRNRLIVPLLSKNDIFAFIHLPFKDQSKFQEVKPQHVKKLSRKLSETIISEQLDLQKERIKEKEKLESFLDKYNSENPNDKFILLYFYTKYNDKPSIQSSPLLDINCLVRKNIKECVQSLSCEENILFEKHNQFFCLIQSSEIEHQNMVSYFKSECQKSVQNSSIIDVKVSVSAPIRSLNDFDVKIKSVMKIMEIGHKVQPDEKVYTYDKLGIYEILINLSTNPAAMLYADEVLSPLTSGDGELLETLIAFLKENGNVSRTAETLFIHRRTMTYRLQKIKELLNMQLDDPENLFILRFCLKMKEYI
ncbi:PucR family transcriptional regulator [Tepidibacillus sp. HK-1]|uniref:PucR family transcriptional regulator n=1 Tax=Tepidibacillus sp. HK-1 TaxID=1883407 RepID=UPI000853555F|nr:PucR family transcriptional regulator [Tepidibacillus sp. HK-1]GBF11206.1 purine catabolism regulatory protein [Tepidibacillus sp. HK-1]